jgi:Ca2+-binding RTX toxin-like protein
MKTVRSPVLVGDPFNLNHVNPPRCRWQTLATLLVGLGIAAAFAGTPSAYASKVRLEGRSDTLVFTAGVGESNRVTFGAVLPSGDLVVTDRGARLAAGQGCEALSRHRARCPVVENVLIYLGDASDVLSLAAFEEPEILYVEAGGGDDSVTFAGRGDVIGGGGADTLIGGVGYNGLYGNRGRDILSAGHGDDDLYGGAGSDVLKGGRGHDTAIFGFKATGPVTVDLARSLAVEARGIDRLRGLENVTGTRFADTLKGDAGPNTLDGQQSHDIIRGRGGEDTLDGGAGNDTIFARDALADVVDGASGLDRARVDEGIDQSLGIEVFF